MNKLAIEIFSKNIGIQNNAGVHHCFYTGLFCDELNSVDDRVKSTFTDCFDKPGSAGARYVSNVALSAMNEKAKIELCDGSTRENQKIRTYSWYIEEGRNIAFTKSHKLWLRSFLFEKRKTPFSLVITTTGQKHILYKAPVNYSVDNFIVQFDNYQFFVDLADLKGALVVLDLLSFYLGKKSLENFDIILVGFSKIIKDIGQEKGEALLEEYDNLSNLKVFPFYLFLTKSKEDFKNENTKGN